MELKKYISNEGNLLKKLSQKYDVTTDVLDHILVDNLKFQVRLPLIGAFSSGKSSLVNSLLKDRIFPVEVNPETCLPAEVHYGSEENLSLCGLSGESRPITRPQIKAQDYGLAEDGNVTRWLDVALPNPILAQCPELVLVDMPGWESGIAQHCHAIDNYVHRSGAYCLVVSVDDGNLRESLKRVLAELKLFNKPIMVVLTKCDKRPEEDTEAVARQIVAEVESVIGSAPLAVVKVSRKKNIEAFISAVHQVNQLSSDIHHQAIIKPLKAYISQLESTLRVLLNDDNLEVEQIAVEQQQRQHELELLRVQLNDAGELLDSIVPTTVDRVLELFSNRLTAQVDSLARAAIHQGDIEGIIGSTQRLAFTEGLELEFKPRIRQQIQSISPINAEDPQGFSVEMNFKSSGENSITKDILSDVLPMLIGVLTRTPILIPLAPLITRLIKGVFANKEKEFQARQHLEDAKQYVLSSLIPDICARSRNTVEEALLKSVAEIKQQLMSDTEVRGEQHLEALRKLAVNLEQSQQQQRQLKDEYLADLDTLLTFTAGLEVK